MLYHRLLYHPMYDSNHCAFRLLCLAHDCKLEQPSWQLIKILDFYTLFPHFLKDLSLQALRSYKKDLKEIPTPYENLPSSKQLMFQLGELQEIVIKSLIAKDLVDREMYLRGKVSINKDMVSEKLKKILDAASFKKEKWYQFLTQDFVKLPLYGSKGIKAKTGLMEHRYDPV